MTSLKQHLVDLKFHKSVIPIRSMIKAFRDAYPSIRLLSRRRRETITKEFNQCSTVQECIEFTRRHMGNGSCQIPSEIESAIRLIAATYPRIMCEIGTFNGGTSLLFSRFLPTLELMLCIDLYVKNKGILKLLATPGQQLHFFDMPSYSRESLNTVDRFLNGRMIDALFIDGDHRYEGVRQDFLFYRTHVRDGGLILFHDIVEDRGGGRAWAGGVPKLWKELSPYYCHREFIHSVNQEGFGIGVLTHSTAVQLPLWVAR